MKKFEKVCKYFFKSVKKYLFTPQSFGSRYSVITRHLHTSACTAYSSLALPIHAEVLGSVSALSAFSNEAQYTLNAS